MRIVTDQDILAVDGCFSQWGELIKIPGRDISNIDLLAADALLVRSITPVNEKLLGNTPVKFVATATAGTDHIDVSYLHERNISFAHAPGANANAVVDYCFAGLAKLALESELTLQEFLKKEFAIFGVGNVGGLLYKKLSELGVSCRAYDPIAQLHNPMPSFNFCSLDQALTADIVSLHVPMTERGPYPTVGMINQNNLSLLPDHAVLINTSRGGVIDENALLAFLDQRQDVRSIVDVWCNEPDPDCKLISEVDIATPHIAGYSLDAKQAATEMIAEAFAEFFNFTNPGGVGGKLRDKDRGGLRLAIEGASDQAVFTALLEAFAVSDLSTVFKTLAQRRMLDENFDLLRKEIALRREFFAYGIEGKSLSDLELTYLTTMGMQQLGGA